MNDKNSINATNAAERSVKIFDEGNQVLDILALSMHKQATAWMMDTVDKYKG